MNVPPNTVFKNQFVFKNIVFPKILANDENGKYLFIQSVYIGISKPATPRVPYPK